MPVAPIWRLLAKKYKKEKEEALQAPGQDRHLDTPAEANTEKHIKFLDAEDVNSSDRRGHHDDKTTEERQKQWKKGLEEGKRANREQS